MATLVSSIGPLRPLHAVLCVQLRGLSSPPVPPVRKPLDAAAPANMPFHVHRDLLEMSCACMASWGECCQTNALKFRQIGPHIKSPIKKVRRPH